MKQRKLIHAGPGEYDPDHEKIKPSAAGWKFGTQGRPSAVGNDKAKLPGVGQYNIPG